jgi:site-specific recombinase XerD
MSSNERKNTKVAVRESTERRNNLLLEFLFYTGLRLNELANLKHSD